MGTFSDSMVMALPASDWHDTCLTVNPLRIAISFSRFA
jgi:hypothetical protein